MHKLKLKEFESKGYFNIYKSEKKGKKQDKIIGFV